MLDLLPEDLLDCLRADGYGQLRISPPAWQRLQQVIETALAFFRQPLEQKMPNVYPGECGYRQLGVEYSQVPERPDQVESFTVSGRMIGRRLRSASPLAAALCDQMLGVFEDLEAIVEGIATRLATTLSGRTNASELRGALRHWSRLQLNYSRPTDVPLPLIHDLHEDGSFITLAGATAPGLEIQTRRGGYLGVTTPPGELIVMPGDIAALLTGGVVAPLYHRVHPDRRVSERLAYLFFADIDPSRCQPWVRNDSNEGVDIAARVRSNVHKFGLKGFGPDD